MEFVWPVICILLAMNLAMTWFLRKEKSQLKVTNMPPQQVNVNLKPLQDSIEDLPNKVLQSIVSCTNTHKGALGELIGYVQLHARYDRIIPLGNIVDFIGIKFETKNEEGKVSEGCIDFIDVKTGDKARLSRDQRELQKLIQEKRINFIKLKVETTNLEE